MLLRTLIYSRKSERELVYSTNAHEQTLQSIQTPFTLASEFIISIVHFASNKTKIKLVSVLKIEWVLMCFFA